MIGAVNARQRAAPRRLLLLRFFLRAPLERAPHESSIQSTRGTMFERGLSYLKKARVSPALSRVTLGRRKSSVSRVLTEDHYEAADPQRNAAPKLAKRLLLLLLRDSRRVYEAGKRTSFGHGERERV